MQACGEKLNELEAEVTKLTEAIQPFVKKDDGAEAVLTEEVTASAGEKLLA